MAKQTSGSKRRPQTVPVKEGANSNLSTPNAGGKASTSKASSKLSTPNAGSKASSQNGSNRQGASAQAQSQGQGKRSASRAAQRAAKQQQRERQLKDDRRAGLITLLCILAAVVVGGGLIGGLILYNNHNAANPTASVPVNPVYPAVDGISCDAGEQLAYHIHAHVSIYINGKLTTIPQNVGIDPGGSCIYWLHTHDTSGVIHIESPTQKDYILGNFLDEWSQRFSSLGYPSELDLTSGWQVWIDGKPYTGDFHNIPLTAHKLITLAYNSPNVKPDTTYSWGNL